MKHIRITTDMVHLNPKIRTGMAFMLAERRSKRAAGDKGIGWKVGFGGAEIMAKLGIDRPLVGYLCKSSRLASGAKVSLAGFKKAVAEPEVAIYLGSPVGPNTSEAKIRSAISAIGPAIEIADLHTPPEDVEEILHANIYQRHVILGKPDTKRSGAALAGISAEITSDRREPMEQSDLEANTGRLIKLVGIVADTLAANGERLHAGSFIIAGSVVPPMFIEGPEEITYHLKPFPPISVRFVA